MILAALPEWAWWTAGGVIAAVVVFGLLAWLVRRAEDQSRRREDLWALEQLAQLLGRRNGASPEATSRALRQGDRTVLPPDYDGAQLLYERSTGPGDRIRKALVVSFRGDQPQRMTMEVAVAWADLPADVRAEMIRGGKTATRPVAFPACSGRTREEA